MLGILHIQLLGMSYGSNSRPSKEEMQHLFTPLHEGNTGTTSSSQNGQSFEKVGGEWQF